MAGEKRVKLPLQHSHMFANIGLFFVKLIVFLLNKIIRLALPQPSRQNQLVAWLNENLPGEDVNLHQEEALWRDGSLLCSLVNSVVPEACLNPHCHFGCPPEHGQALAYKYLGIKPVFNEHDFNQPTLSEEQHKNFKKYLKKVQKSITHFTDSVRNLKYCTDYVAKGMGLVACEQNRKASFFLYPIRKKYPHHDVEINIKGPYSTSGHITVPAIDHKHMTNYKRPLYLSGKTSNVSPTLQGSRFLRILTKNYGGNLEDDIIISIKVTKTYVKITYIPKNCGIHEVILSTNGYQLIGSPFSVIVESASNKYVSNDSLSDGDDKLEYEKRKYIPSIVHVKGQKMLLQENGTLEKIPDGDKTNINEKQIDDNSNDHQIENKILKIINEVEKTHDDALISLENNDDIEQEWNEIFKYNAIAESLYKSNYFEDKFEEIFRDNCTDTSDNETGNNYNNSQSLYNKKLTNTINEVGESKLNKEGIEDIKTFKPNNSNFNEINSENTKFNFDVPSANITPTDETDNTNNEISESFDTITSKKSNIYQDGFNNNKNLFSIEDCAMNLMEGYLYHAEPQGKEPERCEIKNESNTKPQQNRNYEQDELFVDCEKDLQLISKTFDILEVPILETERVVEEQNLDDIQKTLSEAGEMENACSMEESGIDFVENLKTVHILCCTRPKENVDEIFEIKDTNYQKKTRTKQNENELDNYEHTKIMVDSKTPDILKTDTEKTDLYNELFENVNVFCIEESGVCLTEEKSTNVTNDEEIKKEQFENTVELNDSKINELFVDCETDFEKQATDIMEGPILESNYVEEGQNIDDIKKTFSRKDPFYRLFNSKEFQFNRIPETYKMLVDIFEPKNIVVEEPVPYSNNINVEYETSSPDNSPDLVNCHNLNSLRKIVPESQYVQHFKKYKGLNRKLKHIGVACKSLDKKQRFLKCVLIENLRNNLNQNHQRNNNVEGELHRTGGTDIDLDLEWKEHKPNIFERLKLSKMLESEPSQLQDPRPAFRTKRIDEDKYNFIIDNSKEFKEPKIIETIEGIVDSKIKLLSKEENQTKKDIPVDLKFLPIDGLVKAKRQIFEEELTNKTIDLPSKISKAKTDETVKIFPPKERTPSLPKKSGKSKNIENFSPSPIEDRNKNENVSPSFEEIQDVNNTDINFKIKSTKETKMNEKRRKRFQQAKNLFKSLENSSTEVTAMSSTSDED